MKDVRVLLTGATGYIGSNLARRLLRDGSKVHVIVRHDSSGNLLRDVRNEICYHVHDGTSKCMIEIVRSSGPQVVFHLASHFLAKHSPEDIELLIGSNVIFSTQLVEAMIANNVKYLINTGTSWQHYENRQYCPVNLYAATKQAFQDVLAYYIDAHGLKVCTLALFDTYGPNDPRAKVLALLWKSAQLRQELVMSPGQQLLDLVYIDDVVSAFIAAAARYSEQRGGHAVYGISSGRPISLVELVSIFEMATGETLNVKWGGRDYRPREVMKPWVDFDLLPNWYPTIELDVGILLAKPGALLGGT
jgi:nucleoside-diphosphate-sugar epimerase